MVTRGNPAANQSLVPLFTIHNSLFTRLRHHHVKLHGVGQRADGIALVEVVNFVEVRVDVAPLPQQRLPFDGVDVDQVFVTQQLRTLPADVDDFRAIARAHGDVVVVLRGDVAPLQALRELRGLTDEAMVNAVRSRLLDFGTLRPGACASGDRAAADRPAGTDGTACAVARPDRWSSSVASTYHDR